MRCAQAGPLVERYVDGVLDPGLARAIRDHAVTCTRCARRIEAARAVRDILASEPALRAPRGFADSVMDAVYREALAGPQAGAREERETRPLLTAGSARTYRRLGLSFLLTAGVLAASLLVPRIAYPTLFGAAETGLSRDSGAVVRGAMNGAETMVRDILREQENGGSAR